MSLHDACAFAGHVFFSAFDDNAIAPVFYPFEYKADVSFRVKRETW